jgi:hypothetical protein
LEAGDQSPDYQHRDHHAYPADAELLAGENLAGAIEQREAQQYSCKARDRKQLGHDQRNLQCKIFETENAEAAVMDQSFESIENIAEQISCGECGEAHHERPEKRSRQKTIDGRRKVARANHHGTPRDRSKRSIRSHM